MDRYASIKSTKKKLIKHQYSIQTITMKQLILLFCLLFLSYSYAQNENKIKVLEYTNLEIEVPKNCTAKSKYELLDCNGVSAQWMYFNEAILKPAFGQLIEQVGKSSLSKEPIEIKSLGATLKGFKFTYKDKKTSNRIVVYGVVNKQPLILNVASEDELVAIYSNTFLKNMIEFKM